MGAGTRTPADRMGSIGPSCRGAALTAFPANLPKVITPPVPPPALELPEQRVKTPVCLLTLGCACSDGVPPISRPRNLTFLCQPRAKTWSIRCSTSAGVDVGDPCFGPRHRRRPHVVTAPSAWVRGLGIEIDRGGQAMAREKHKKTASPTSGRVKEQGPVHHDLSNYSVIPCYLRRTSK